MKTLGFRIDETMTGYHQFEKNKGPQGRLFMEFVAVWGPQDIKQWINPRAKEFLKQPLKGHVTVEGLCTKAPIKGMLELKYFDEHCIRYSFDFKVKQKSYHFIGEKVNIKPWNLPVSHTTCFGRLTEKKSGKLVSTSVTYFRLGTLPQFIKSFRLIRS